MDFIKRNFKHVLMSITLFFFVLMLGLGLGLSAFGMGMESQRFITSVEKTIDKYIPKGKVVIDGSKLDFIYKIAVDKLKESYATDVLSTLTDEQKNNPEIKKFWEEYAANKFEARWQAVVDKKEDIDINEFSRSLVDFDKQVAAEFHNYGFTHSGLQWIGQKDVLSQLWSLNYTSLQAYQEAKQNQEIIKQSDYKTGTYLVNNKVQFINDQIETLVSPLTLIAFKDADSVKETLLVKDAEGNDVPVQVSIDDLYHPNYTKAFEQTRVGAIFLIILTPIFGLVFISFSLSGYYFFKNGLVSTNKKTKATDEQPVLQEVELLK